MSADNLFVLSLVCLAAGLGGVALLFWSEYRRARL